MAKDNEEKKNNPIISAINGVGRFVGLSLFAVTFAGAFARATIGTVVNAVKAVGGGIGTFVSLGAHAIDYARVRLIRGGNYLIGRTPTNPANTDFTKKMFDESWDYTKSRAAATNPFSEKGSFYKVFSGEKDEQYKARLVSVFEAKDKAIEAQNKQTESTRVSFSVKTKKTFKEMIGSMPNTWGVIAKSSQLMRGMTPTQRKAADTKHVNSR